jgi:hypothetical protein
MRQSATGFFTCSHCDAAYESDAALQLHKNTAHRGRGSAQRASDLPAIAEPSSESQPPDQQKFDPAEGRVPGLSRTART